jgi:hypothetical protein
MQWFWDAIHDLIFRQRVQRENREAAALCADNARMVAEMDRKIAEVFTPKEWEATRRRCEAKLGPITFT